MNIRSLSIFLTLAATAASAETGVLDYTYAQGSIVPFGKEKAETADVAIRINDPELVGMKLVGFKAYINTTDGIANTSLWLSKELKIESKANVPDIASYEVAPTSVTMGNNTYGMLSIDLPEPYVLTADPLYIGYTMTIEEVNTEAQKRPILISKGENPNGMFLHMSKTVLKWLEYTEQAGGVAYIVAQIEGDFPENSLGFASCSPLYAMENEAFTGEFFVANVGTQQVKDIKYTYGFDGGAPLEGTASFDPPVPSALVATTPVTLSFEGVSGFGKHELDITVAEVNGRKNESANPSIKCEVNVIPFKPVHRPLVEEYTGLWCGWCPGGYIAMEMISEEFGDSQVSVCYHDDDQMAVTSNFALPISEFPASSIDRMAVIDPYSGTYDDSVDFGIGLDLENAIATFALAGIEVDSNVEDDMVNGVARVRFVRDIDDANYAIGYVLTCSGLTDPSWIQQNYYSGRDNYKGTPLEILTTWPKTVKGLVFNDVAVNVDGLMGVEGSLPSGIVTNEEYTYYFSMDISDNRLVQNVENLAVVAFVVDKSTGIIINSNKSVPRITAVEDIMMNASPVSVEYYDLAGRRVTALEHGGIYIVRQKYSDGITKTLKVVR